MKRYFTHRYPIFGTSHEKTGPIVIRVSAALVIFASYMTYKAYAKIESSKLSREKTYEKVDPNKIIPFSSEIKPVNHEYLRKVVLQGDEFIINQLKVKVINTPEEFVIQSAQGIQDKQAFLDYLAQEFKKLPNERTQRIDRIQ